MVFICVNQAWAFNCDIEYMIKDSKRSLTSFFGDDFEIVPYCPETLEDDYCAFLHNVNPSYEKFSDAEYFTEKMRNSEHEQITMSPKSSLEHLSSIVK